MSVTVADLDELVREIKKAFPEGHQFGNDIATGIAENVVAHMWRSELQLHDVFPSTRTLDEEGTGDGSTAVQL